MSLFYSVRLITFPAAVLLASIAPFASNAAAATVYTYDLVGRVTTEKYDNGVCVAYSYDASGNRTAQTNTTTAGPSTPTWGTGTWGCFNWTP